MAAWRGVFDTLMNHGPRVVLKTYLLWGPMLDFHVCMMQGYYYFDNAKVRPYALLSKGNKQPDHLHQATCTWTPTHVRRCASMEQPTRGPSHRSSCSHSHGESVHTCTCRGGL